MSVRRVCRLPFPSPPPRWPLSPGMRWCGLLGPHVTTAGRPLSPAQHAVLEMAETLRSQPGASPAAVASQLSDSNMEAAAELGGVLGLARAHSAVFTVAGGALSLTTTDLDALRSLVGVEPEPEVGSGEPVLAEELMLLVGTDPTPAAGIVGLLSRRAAAELDRDHGSSLEVAMAAVFGPGAFAVGHGDEGTTVCLRSQSTPPPPEDLPHAGAPPDCTLPPELPAVELPGGPAEEVPVLEAEEEPMAAPEATMTMPEVTAVPPPPATPTLVALGATPAMKPDPVLQGAPAAPAAPAGPGPSDDDATLKAEDFVPYVPTFFVPIDRVLAQLPAGYTAAHLEEYLARTRAYQFIHFGGQCFVRLHGWFGYFDINAAAAANERYAEFEPRPELAEPFLKLLPPRQWVPLRELIEGAPPEAVQALPFHGPTSLFFFAQLQHLFSFTTDDGGRVSRSMHASLGPDTTPCPLTLNDAFIKTKASPMDVQAVLAAFEPAARAQLFAFFPSVPAWAAAHAQYFHFDPATKVLQQAREREREALKAAPLEAQLDRAYQESNKKKIRALRRKQQMMQNPDDPLLDREHLMRAVAEFLPPDRHITMHRLVKNLPLEIVNMMPNTHTKVFKNNPQHFTFFEHKFPNNFCVQRPGLPLPDGALKLEYSEAELVDVVVQQLQRRRTQNTEQIMIHIAAGARNAIKKHYGSLQALVAKYPQQFAVVSVDETNRIGNKLVTLLQSRHGAGADLSTPDQGTDQDTADSPDAQSFGADDGSRE